jgi:MFS transporter, Spinster family, sphingosine-1-phosphate transporter
MLVPGLICCGLLASLQEPARTFTASKSSPLDWSGFHDWAIRLKIFIPHHVGFALATFGGFAISAWLPTILIREHAFGARQAGMTYGALVAVVGCASAYVGGVLGDYRSHQDGSRGRISVAIYSIPFAIVGFTLMWLVQSALAVFVGAILVTAGLGIAMVIGLLSISDLSPPESRGQISSIYLMFTGFIGSAGGPAIVGYANDVIGRSDRPLSTILGTTGMVACIAAVGLLLLSLGRIHAPVKQSS